MSLKFRTIPDICTHFVVTKVAQISGFNCTGAYCIYTLQIPMTHIQMPFRSGVNGLQRGHKISILGTADASYPFPV